MQAYEAVMMAFITSPADFLLDSSTLHTFSHPLSVLHHRLFEGAGQGLNGLKASERKAKPPLREMLSKVIDELHPDEGIEEQYKVGTPCNFDMLVHQVSR